MILVSIHITSLTSSSHNHNPKLPNHTQRIDKLKNYQFNELETRETMC